MIRFNSRAVALACAVLCLLSLLAMPATAATNTTNSTDTADGLVESVTPDFLSDLMADLPVPDVVKDLFGAADTDGDGT